MTSEAKSPALDEYLGRVRSHLPLFAGGDILRELESSIRDRVDDVAAAESLAPDDSVVRRVLADMGEPETVADAFARERSIVAGANFGSFLLYTAIVFAVHVSLVGVATTMGTALRFGPLGVSPVGSGGLVSLAASVVHALLLDVGLMVFAFAGAGMLRRRVRFAPKALAVDASPRAAAGRALLAVLVAVVLNAFRDKVFVVVTDHVAYPLFTEWFVGVLPLVTAVLVVSVVSDAMYLFLGETRPTVAVDALHGAAGLACMLHLLRGDPILALPPVEQFAQFHAAVNSFLGGLGTLVVGFLALVFAVKTVRRMIRFSQI
jgi:hypothetical protein